MTPPERLALTALLAEIDDDLQAIDKLAGRTADLRRQGAGTEPLPVEVMAAAGYLHHLYTAMESIHDRIAAQVDGGRPTGERWHQELLARMGIAIPGVRPAVLGPATRAQLARLLRFRHFFRHAYRIDLLWVEVEPLLRDAPAVVSGYRADLAAFCDHLRAALSEG